MDGRKELGPALFWLGLSVLVMIGAYQLNLGTLHVPGPGLMPFLGGAALFPFALSLVVRSLSAGAGRAGEAAGAAGAGPLKIGLVLAALIVHALLLERLGYLLATALLLIFLFRIAGSNRWGIVLAASILTVAASYLLFNALGVTFPEGIIGFRL